jgi:hypothetical protein
MTIARPLDRHLRGGRHHRVDLVDHTGPHHPSQSDRRARPPLSATGREDRHGPGARHDGCRRARPALHSHRIPAPTGER